MSPRSLLAAGFLAIAAALVTVPFVSPQEPRVAVTPSKDEPTITSLKAEIKRLEERNNFDHVTLALAINGVSEELQYYIGNHPTPRRKSLPQLSFYGGFCVPSGLKVEGYPRGIGP